MSVNGSWVSVSTPSVCIWENCSNSCVMVAWFCSSTLPFSIRYTIAPAPVSASVVRRATAAVIRRRTDAPDRRDSCRHRHRRVRSRRSRPRRCCRRCRCRRRHRCCSRCRHRCCRWTRWSRRHRSRCCPLSRHHRRSRCGRRCRRHRCRRGCRGRRSCPARPSRRPRRPARPSRSRRRHRRRRRRRSCADSLGSLLGWVLGVDDGSVEGLMRGRSRSPGSRSCPAPDLRSPRTRPAIRRRTRSEGARVPGAGRSSTACA